MWMMLSNMLLAFSLNFIGMVVIKRMSAVAYVLGRLTEHEMNTSYIYLLNRGS